MVANCYYLCDDDIVPYSSRAKGKGESGERWDILLDFLVEKTILWFFVGGKAQPE